MWSGIAVLCGALLMGGLEDRPTVFEGWFHSATVGNLEIPETVALKARSFRYVFVGGFRNENMPGYFAQNIAELRALGVPKRQIDEIHPSSSRTSEDNAVTVREKFVEIASKGPEKLVIIAHSRGACDALAFALGNASFVEDRVEALYLIQGAFGGSGLADYVVGKGIPMDRRMALRYRIMGNLMGRLARFMAKRSGMDAMEGLTRKTSRAFWTKTLEKYADAKATVGPKTFYLRSTIAPSKLRFARRAIAWYLEIAYGSSDGMIVLADQALPAIGTVIGTIEASHFDLTHRFPATHAPRSHRRALIQSIMMAVGQPRAVEASTARELSPSTPSGGRLDPLKDGVPKSQPGLEGDRRGESRVSPASRVGSAN
jgi:pimeloyl-ACP methyl ester carboxylesterase